MSSRYRVEYERSARKQLARLDPRVQARILRRIAALADNPRPAGVTRLAGAANLWRIRIGDYRVVYTINDEQLLVVVVRIATRGQVYRGM